MRHLLTLGPQSKSHGSETGICLQTLLHFRHSLVAPLLHSLRESVERSQTLSLSVATEKRTRRFSFCTAGRSGKNSTSALLSSSLPTLSSHCCVLPLLHNTLLRWAGSLYPCRDIFNPTSSLFLNQGRQDLLRPSPPLSSFLCQLLALLQPVSSSSGSGAGVVDEVHRAAHKQWSVGVGAGVCGSGWNLY